MGSKIMNVVVVFLVVVFCLFLVLIFKTNDYSSVSYVGIVIVGLDILLRYFLDNRLPEKYISVFFWIFLTIGLVLINWGR